MSIAADDRAARPAYRGMALRIAREMCGKPWMRDDLRAAALLGLVEASRTFDESRGATFRDWAGRRIRGAVLDEMRRLRNAHKMQGVRRAVPLGPLPAGDHEALHAAEGPVGWEVESADAVEGMARRLPPRLADALRVSYLDASVGRRRSDRLQAACGRAVRRLREVS